MGLSIPSFYGYYNAHRGILANQIALNTINHNISNVSTPGYSRQNAVLTSGSPFPPATLSNFTESGQIGQGVNVAGIARTHDNFLDGQMRIQNSLQGYQNVLRDVLQQVEGTLNEPSDSGINSAINNFFASAQAMSIHPDDQASRTAFMRSASTMLDTLKQQAQQLQDLRTNIIGDPNVVGTFPASQVALTVDSINNDLDQVRNLNSQILTVVASGATPNDLLDKRDQLLEHLSQNINISVEYGASEQVTVSLAGFELVRGVTAIESLTAIQNPGPAPDPDDQPAIIQLSNSATDVTANITDGRLGGLLKIGGNDPDISTVRNVLEGMDALFTEIATTINNLQATGRDFYGNVPAAPDNGVFTLAGGVGIDLFFYDVNIDLINDPKLVAAANDNAGVFDGVGDGRNALAMARLQNNISVPLGNTTIPEYFNNLISKLGNSTKAADDSSTNLESVIEQLSQRRESVQGVNLEEEMINLLRFQRGFEASAKVLSIIDGAFDTIINKMI